MVALSPGTPVRLVSNVAAIEMQRRSGGRVRWSLLEVPSVSLEQAGFPPTSETDAAAEVQLDAVASGKTVAVTLVVSAGREETARFRTVFREAALEPAPDGRMRVVVPLPARVVPGARANFESDQGYAALDQTFILLRKAIGTADEAADSAQRVLRPARRASSAANQQPPRHLYGDETDARCLGRIVTHAAEVAAGDGHELGQPLRQVSFTQAGAPAAHAHMKRSDQLVCIGDDVWIIGYAATRPTIRLRRYSAAGELLRSVESTLPARSGKGFDLIDPDSVREADGRIYFDRIIAGHRLREVEYRKRERFEVEL